MFDESTTIHASQFLIEFDNQIANWEGWIISLIKLL